MEGRGLRRPLDPPTKAARERGARWRGDSSTCRGLPPLIRKLALWAAASRQGFRAGNRVIESGHPEWSASPLQLPFDRLRAAGNERPGFSAASPNFFFAPLPPPFPSFLPKEGGFRGDGSPSSALADVVATTVARIAAFPSAACALGPRLAYKWASVIRLFGKFRKKPRKLTPEPVII